MRSKTLDSSRVAFRNVNAEVIYHQLDSVVDLGSGLPRIHSTAELNLDASKFHVANSPMPGTSFRDNVDFVHHSGWFGSDPVMTGMLVDLIARS